MSEFDSHSEADREVFLEFLEESLDQLYELKNWLLRFEQEPNDLKWIEKVFRAIHSIKGASGFFGLSKIQKLAHSLENIFDLLRKREISATPSVISLSLEGTVFLQEMLERSQNDKSEIEDTSQYDKIIQDIEVFIQQKRGAAAEVLLCLSAYKAFVSKLPDSEQKGPLFFELQEKAKELEVLAEKNLRETIQAFIQCFEKQSKEFQPEILKSPDFELLDKEIVRLRATEASIPSGPQFRKTKDYFYDGVDVSGEICTIEEILNFPEDQTIPVNTAQRMTEALISLQDKVNNSGLVLVTRMRISLELVLSGVKKFEEPLRRELQRQFEKLLEMCITPVVEKEETKKEVEEKEEKQEKVEIKTIRVAEEEIDRFAHFVGELVVVSEMFDNIGTSMLQDYHNSDLGERFKQVNQTFNELSQNLIESLLKVRLLPVNGLFRKLPGLVRTLADKIGKQARIDLRGGDLKIDKSLYDLLDHPLTHLIRNSIDHGVELPEIRKKVGKPDCGLIQVEAQGDGDWVMLTIQDDGQGLDVEKIRKKALEKGLYTADKIDELSEDDLHELIFLPGFSTAAEVTEISGRGVGMDVVKQNIEEVNGRIQIKSEKGKGTAFQIRLPSSTSFVIIEGLNTIVGGQEYIFPVETVQTAFRPDRKDIVHTSRQEMVRYKDRILPILRLYKAFDIEAEINDPVEGILILIKHKKKEFTVLVDQLIGKTQVVVKELKLDELLMTGHGNEIAGGAIMGHGGIALVLNIDELNNMLPKQTM